MHIPNGMLQGAICPVTAVVSALGIGLAAFKAFSSQVKPTAAYFSAVTALIFAGQMINFPINGGTSGHLLGGVLAVALLGLPFGILSIALVVTVQCLVFSDGGVVVLGANILNMALVGAGLGGFIYSILKQHNASFAWRLGAVAIASWISLMAAAFTCSLELALAGTIPFSRVAVAMLSVHGMIGIGEALVTLAAVVALSSIWIETSDRRSLAVPSLAAVIIAAVLSPFASGLPDGLEWVAQKYAFLHESAPTFVSPLSDYAVSAISNEMLTTSIAGLSGVIISFAIAWILAKALDKPGKLEISA